jgi:hypothetical protein
MSKVWGGRSLKRLARVRSLGVLAWIVAMLLGTVSRDARAGEAGEDQGDLLVVHLVHPEGQAAALMKLFEGARARHPAAALAAWKAAAARPPRELGKPLEALIALFNPEMSREWRVMHGVRVAVNWDAARARPAWHAVIPQDDGTIAAAVAAMRLSEGAGERAFDFRGKPIAVERLGLPGATLAARAGDSLIFGSSRDELVRAARLLAGSKAGLPAVPVSGKPLLSGASFALDVGRLAREPAPPLPARALAELLRGLSCRRVEGSLALEGDSLGLDFSMLLRPDAGVGSALREGFAPIDPAWLECIPASGAMAVITLAFRPTREFWDSAFALADRLEKTDPGRAETAPLRARLTLLARTAGVRLEAELWPHLIGLTAGILGERRRPGRPTGAVVALHLDSDTAAERLLTQSGPGLAKLIGRDVTAWRAGRNIIAAWGNGAEAAARDAAANPERSVAPLCTTWSRAGKPVPHRLAAFWPARCWPLEREALAPWAAWSVLAEDPPALWLGWDEETKSFDTIRWAGLDRRVRRFLDQIPLEQVSAR